MTTKHTLIAGVLSALMLPAAASASPLVFQNFRGTMHLVQDVPCNGVIDTTTTIADGVMEIAPLAAGREGGGVRQFDLTKLQMFMTPFSLQMECLGVKATVAFREIGAKLESSVRFTAEPIGSLEDQHYRFRIPRMQVLLFESVLDNLPVPQPETAYQRPSEDITGEFNLRERTVTLHLALGAKLHFQVGCVDGRCLIDETLSGKQTVDARGAFVNPFTDTDRDGVVDTRDNCPLVPNPRQESVATPVLKVPQDAWFSSCQAQNIGKAEARDVCHARPVNVTNNAPATFPIGKTIVMWMASDGIDPSVSAPQAVNVVADRAPVVSCAAVTPQRFRVAATDDCSAPTLKLGSFALTNGEVIQVEQTGKPGVRLLGTVGPENKIRHFQVGKGEAIILAADAAGNVGRAACSVAASDTTEQPVQTVKK
jgi:hypothetical protein